ncbi:integrase/recombinase XerD [Clostridium neonatale]|uniref:tyrosine-type recombinase/integrase n=1 Tax=Clostridium neonatale TaxID=137838 RepID=UPI00291B7A44|nr:tyrosine-type recombinase/integrase [Clostridium neonatale]CAI3673271.1 integrase/recombinase XerD [Clostridium neonatale]
MLLEQLLSEFILELEIREYSKRTLKGYKNNNLLLFTYLKKQFEIEKIEDVKPTHIKAYIKFLQKQGRKTTYINGVIKSFRAFFKYAINEEIIEENPMLKVGWLKEGKVIINTFNNQEVENMINTYSGSDYMTIRNKTILVILFDTGLRNLELCNLTNKDITDTFLTVKQGKGRKDRRVALSPYTRKVILRYIRCRDSYFENRIIDENTPFFLSYRFKPLTIEAVERVVKIAGQKADIRKEIRCSPHTARHYFAQAQLRNGLDVYSLSRLLGHENISITKRYLQSLDDEQIVEMSIKTSPLMNLNIKK